VERSLTHYVEGHRRSRTKAVRATDVPFRSVVERVKVTAFGASTAAGFGATTVDAVFFSALSPLPS